MIECEDVSTRIEGGIYIKSVLQAHDGLIVVAIATDAPSSIEIEYAGARHILRVKSTPTNCVPY